MEGKDRISSEVLAFFSSFLTWKPLVGKVREVKGFVNASAFLLKMVHLAHSKQSF